ncbi:hypothetical protein IV203_031399 [Nitzschia inconspicua]|uniref:Uncharacterized protein n=1 Tax=Nitzschia inconspicua TaxID=303405 RepID=A0A9K3LY01_9STRA|nr:hypothetical protein IV203_031399 [Nitzschia inconspicua]
MHFLLLVLVAFLSVETCGGLIARRPDDDKDFEVVSNPHVTTDEQCKPNHNIGDNNDDAIHSCSTTNRMNLDVLLEPYYLIRQVVPTQVDTFQTLSHVKIMSVPVPTYHMKQPARLSSLELEFQLVLAKDLTATGKSSIQEVPVDPIRAQDSWFPGYYWTPLVMPTFSGDLEYQHVGWKFTANSEESTSASSPSLPFFMRS